MMNIDLFKKWQTWAMAVVIVLLVALVWPLEVRAMEWLSGPFGVFGSLLAWGLVLSDLVCVWTHRPLPYEIDQESKKVMVWLITILLSLVLISFQGGAVATVGVGLILVRLVLGFALIFLKG